MCDLCRGEGHSHVFEHIISTKPMGIEVVTHNEETESLGLSLWGIEYKNNWNFMGGKQLIYLLKIITFDELSVNDNTWRRERMERTQPYPPNTIQLPYPVA